jgi:hypothetical protein
MQFQQVFVMSVGHGGTTMATERDKHTVVIDDRWSNDRGRGQWMQELVMTNDDD